MSPIAEPTVLDLREYTIRHVGPRAIVFPDSPGLDFTVLSRTDMVARPVPTANIPDNADFVSGKWNGRLYDAADGNLVFPNKEASDGVPWRLRFAPDGKLQWLEIWIDEYLETVLCITKVTPDRNQVLVEGYDGFQMTKSAYVRDWTVVMSPRDVIERGTQLWVPLLVDNFPGPLLNTSLWTNTSQTFAGIGVGALVVVNNNGLKLTATAPGVAGEALAEVQGNAVLYNQDGDVCVASATITLASYTASGSNSNYIALSIGHQDISGVNTGLSLLIKEQPGGALAIFSNAAAGSINGPAISLTPGSSYDLRIETDGRWASAFVNGQLIGQMQAPAGASLGFKPELSIHALHTSTVVATVRSFFSERLTPFLQRGTDKGDYVLPGSASTYPNGGLHARYYNDGDLMADPSQPFKVLTPPRSQAYGGSSNVPEYSNQQDSTINHANSATPTWAPAGCPHDAAGNQTWFSVKWFGAIYLKLSAGNYGFAFTVDDGVRVWIGKTKWGDQIIDGQWVAGGPATSYPTTLTAASLGGKDGWYPIVIEYWQGSGNACAQFVFTPPAGSYVDPGGFTVTGGQQTVPATSLSPLGCIDQRYQGTSHYDLVQKTAIQVGYQFTCEPQSLESGEFPGRVAPRLREGQDTDITLEPDDSQRKDGMINYSAVNDGTDQCSSLQGNGAGFQNGRTGQLQANVYDPATLANSLFDMQGWQDVADASYASLLDTVLQSELGLRLAPWQVIQGDPIGRQRQVQTWPLPGVLSQMRWRPGDGVRIVARDINVNDTTPRQLLLVTRNIHPNGIVSTQVGFAGRPKSSTYSTRKLLAASVRPQRNYQHQLVTLTGSYVGGGGTSFAAGALDTRFSIVTLSPGDTIVKAVLRITNNNLATSVGVYINSTDQTSALGGPWSLMPTTIDVTAVATASVNRIYAQLFNNGVSASTVEYQLLVDVLR